MARAIKRFRSTLGDTQQQFANRTGLAMTTIARYETGWHPKPEVLAKLADIAKERYLPVFVEIFQQHMPPEPYLFHDELPALRGLLHDATSKLTASAADIERGRIALACLSELPAEMFQRVKQVLEPALAPVEQVLEENAGIVSSHREADAEAKYLDFLRKPTLNGGREYLRYAFGEPYEVGYERLWIDVSPEAARTYLEHCRQAFDQREWARPGDSSKHRRALRSAKKPRTVAPA